jgi:phosphoenolpyruvate phosphomutase
MEAAQTLRHLLRAPGPARLVGAHDCLTAALVERAGFEAVWASSLEVSASLGLPDSELICIEEMAQVVYRMAHATPLPVVVDLDTGYGSVRHIYRAVQELERRGAAGICLENKIFPKQNSFAAAGHVLASAAEFSERIHAACSARRSPDFLILARTEALVVGRELGRALEDAAHFEEAGADGIVLHSKQGPATDFHAFLGRWEGRLPVIVIPTHYPGLSLNELREWGAGGVIYANIVLRTIVGAVSNNLCRLHDGALLEDLHELAPIGDVFGLQATMYLHDRVGDIEIARESGALLRTNGARIRTRSG